MFVALLALTLVIPYAATELPSYIHPCGRKEPNYEQCILDNIDSMKDKICIGMPELNVSAREPLFIDKLVIYDTTNLKMLVKDGHVRGFCDFVVNSVHADPDKLHFDFNFLMKHLKVDFIYDFNIHLLTSIAHKGKVNVTLDNIEMKMVIDFKEIINNGRKRIYISKINLNLDIKTFDYKFDESQPELAKIYEVFKDVMDRDKKNIIKKLKPVLAEIISKEIVSVSNYVFCNHSEELFPERTEPNVEH